MSDTAVNKNTGPATETSFGASRVIVTDVTVRGRTHLGDYLETIRPFVALSADPRAAALFLFDGSPPPSLAPAPDRVREHSRELAATLLACGLDDRAVLSRRSAIPGHAELARLLAGTADAKEPPRTGRPAPAPTGSVLSGPPVPEVVALLAHRAQEVPLGQDRHRYLGLAQESARRFNARYGDVLTVPTGLHPPFPDRVRDLRNPAQEMTGSDPGGDPSRAVIHLLDPPVRIAAAIRSAVTDLDPVLGYDPELRPGVSNLVRILATLTGCTPQHALRGLYGAGTLKAAVTEAVVETLRPIRARYTELAADPQALDLRLARGAEAAIASAGVTVAAVRRVLGAG